MAQISSESLEMFWIGSHHALGGIVLSARTA
jgi:hypothetical protein